MLTAVLWLCLALLAFAYVGYPLAMWARARWTPHALQPRAWQPRVDALLVVHDAAAGLARKLDNLLALDYPPERLRVHVACDGCTDASAAIARGHADARVSVHAFPTRRGKSACLGDVLPGLHGDVVLFCDVRQHIAGDALRELVHALSDPRVGAASGELVFERPRECGFASGVDAYWRYERFVRRHEAASGSVVGASGALYAARRALLPPVPAGLILDDLWIPLAVARGGARIAFARGAHAFDHAETDPAAEARRKRRTLAGNFQLIAREPSLLLPWTHPLGWRLWGHKWLRLLAPWLMALALLANLALAARSPAYRLLALAQLGFYALAALAWLAPACARWPPARLAATFVRMNGYAALGLLDFVSGRATAAWRPSTDRGPRA
ncbi:MAG: glycosyltransferase family 2 protein [Rhodanobacteraceae bacterium]|jgi:cellulose synthase/poly-beta-1,6-N-acetylglucosamine synthase-like glycosyltransferase|nr:glycosyltransferase family 2 protein [Rhodanobacteraceae bacterium]